MVLGNEFSVLAGFFLASRGLINFNLLLWVFIGTFLVMGSGCGFNNFLDRGIDKKMERTKKRALAVGEVSPNSAFVFAGLVGVLGLFILLQFTNFLTFGLGIVGLLFYVVLYGWAKRKSVHGTLVGSIAGAIPPVAGYTAVSGRLDIEALILFLILTFWQMPHFYGIAIYRLKDYKAAGIPVLPSVKGIKQTKLQIIFYTIAFIIVSSLLSFLGYTGKIYLVVMGLLGLIWFWDGVKGFRVKDSEKWARKIFSFSLIIIMAFCIAVPLDMLFHI